MPQNLKIVYCVEPDTAALARRAAQFVVEKTAAGSGGARAGADRDQRRVDAQGDV